MSFIQKSSYICAKQLMKKYPYTKFANIEDQISVYDYGFQIFIGALVKGFLLVSISWLLGVLVPAILITLTFSSFRIIAGGYHMQTYSRCINVSLFQFIISALIVKYTNLQWSNIILWSMCIFTILSALYVIVKYVPRDTPNKPITKPEEIRKFKKWSMYYLIGWIIIMIFCLLVNAKIIVLSSCFGLLLELFSISQFGHYVYAKLDNI